MKLYEFVITIKNYNLWLENFMKKIRYEKIGRNKKKTYYRPKENSLFRGFEPTFVQI